MESKKSRKYTIAVPFLTKGFNFKISRKNRWSVIDLLFLKRLGLQDYSLEEISNYSNFKPQLVIQILLPMIKIGWLDIAYAQSNFVFRITDAGKDVCKGDKLPDYAKPYSSYRNVFVDLFGNYYGSHNLKFNPESYTRVHELKKIEEKHLIIFAIDNNEIYPDYDQMFNAVSYENEEAIDVDAFHYSINEVQYMIVDMVYNYTSKLAVIQDPSILSGIDKKFKSLLERTIPNYKNNGIEKVDRGLVSEMYSENIKFDVPLSKVEGVYGGIETKQAFLDLIINSTDYLIIHSTFIGEWAIVDKENNYTHCFLEIKEALKRGVEVYILWGKDEPEEHDSNFQKAKTEIKNIEFLLEKFNDDCIEENIQNFVNYNDFNKTGSHAKFVITNHIEEGPCVMLGSCNFLYTEFLRFEASTVIYNEKFVKYFLTVAADISTGKNLYNNSVRSELRSISSLLNNKNSKLSNEENSCQLALLFKSDHYKYVDLAKKHASNRIYILSDRLNTVPERPIYDALKDSVATKRFFYSTRAPNFSSEEEVYTIAQLRNSYKINLIKHQHKNQYIKGRVLRSHAKVLAWDHNDIVVSSLNWLSSNASVDNNINDTYHELGVHIKGRDVSRKFIKTFNSY